MSHTSHPPWQDHVRGGHDVVTGIGPWWPNARAARRRYLELCGRRPRLAFLRRHSERNHREKVFRRNRRLPVLADKIEVKGHMATHAMLPPRPASWDTMVSVAELTFTPTSGPYPFDPPDTDRLLGRLWRKPRAGLLSGAASRDPMPESEPVRVAR